jgi:dTDP-4-dehydrorhamnose 3,5-epimerase-like enzyme
MPTLRVERLPLRADHRGAVTEPLRPDELPAQRNVHVVLTAPGQVRGNHRHRRGTEVLTVYGPALVRTREPGGDVLDHPVADGEAVRFTIPPGVAHAVRNTGDHPMLIVAFNTEPHDPAAPDVVAEVLIEPPAG